MQRTWNTLSQPESNTNASGTASPGPPHHQTAPPVLKDVVNKSELSALKLTPANWNSWWLGVKIYLSGIGILPFVNPDVEDNELLTIPSTGYTQTALQTVYLDIAQKLDNHVQAYTFSRPDPPEYTLRTPSNASETI